jgi:hypothetical protein
MPKKFGELPTGRNPATQRDVSDTDNPYLYQSAIADNQSPALASCDHA